MPESYRFGPYEVRPSARQVLVGGEVASLGARAFDLLLALIERRERVVPRQELLDVVWPGLVVEENNLSVQLSALRKLLGPQALATVAGRGYRFTAALDEGSQPATPTSPPPAPAMAAPHALPAELDAFVGRSDELATLGERFARGERLVTLVGTGGTGKTRLACRYGHARLADWPGGVFFCDLSEARSRDGIASAAATALDVPLAGGDTVEQLGHAMAGRGRCLIVLDNFEQVVALAPSTLQPWLNSTQHAAFLVTSRQNLGVTGEHVMPLAPMAAAGEGLELFAVRARARRADFELSAANRSDVQQIVTLLDGLPLAIELAAARVSLLSPQQLLARLKDRFALLVGPRGAPQRQATLRNAIDWSWDLLEAWEKSALAQASVFAGAFALEAAEAVIDLSPWPEAPAVMDVVQALLDKSLLHTRQPRSGPHALTDTPYLGLYISIHDYAAEKLRLSGAEPGAGTRPKTEGAGGQATPSAAARAEARHGAYYARAGSEGALDALDMHGGTALRRALANDLENLVAACRRAVAREDGPVAVATFAAAWSVLAIEGPFPAGVALGEPVLAMRSLAADDRARSASVLASALRLAGRTEEVMPHLQTARELFRAAGRRRGLGEVLSHLGDLHHSFLGRLTDAEQFYDQALDIFRALGHRHLEAYGLSRLASLNHVRGQDQASVTLGRQALAMHRESGNLRMMAHELGNLGNYAMDGGHPQEALQLLQEALALSREAGDRRIEGHVLGNLGILHVELGRLDDARRDLDDALTIARESGNRRFESNIRRNQGDLRLSEGQPQEALAFYERALELAREVGNLVGLGRILGHQGGALAQLGRFEPAREAFSEGAALLQAADSRFYLGVLLCQRGRSEVLAGDAAAARQHMEEAQAIVRELGMPDSSLAKEAAALRTALGLAPALP